MSFAQAVFLATHVIIKRRQEEEDPNTHIVYPTKGSLLLKTQQPAVIIQVLNTAVQALDTLLFLDDPFPAADHFRTIAFNCLVRAAEDEGQMAIAERLVSDSLYKRLMRHSVSLLWAACSNLLTGFWSEGNGIFWTPSNGPQAPCKQGYYHTTLSTIQRQGCGNITRSEKAGQAAYTVCQLCISPHKCTWLFIKLKVSLTRIATSLPIPNRTTRRSRFAILQFGMYFTRPLLAPEIIWQTPSTFSNPP